MRIQRSIPAVLAGALALLVFSAAPALAAPEKPTTKPAEEITAKTAVLNGVVNPKKDASVGYDFKYGESEGPTTTCESARNGEPTEFGNIDEQAFKVSAPISNLAPHQKYSFCLRVFQGEEQTNGESLEFETLPFKPVLEGSPRTSGVTPVKATLEAELRASNETTTYNFNYSTSETLVEEGKGTVIAGTPITGNFLEVAHVETGATLTPGTTYYYRITATNGTGTVETEGTPLPSFTTPPVEAPEVLSESVTNVQSTEPRLEARINPKYEETSYSFEYSPSEQTVIEGKGIPVEGAPPAAKLPGVFEELPAGPVTLTGIQPGVYHYRVIATNGTGTTDGPVEQFTTQGNPLADTGGSTAAEVSAQVAGSVTANGAASTYHFVYIDQQGYEAGLRETPGEPYALAKRAPTTGLTEANGQPYLDYTPHAVEVQLGELTPGTTYHYALVAENELGRTLAPGQTLTTAGTAPAAPPVEAEIPGPPPQVSPFPTATLPPLIPYTSIAALDAKEAKEGKATTPTTKTKKCKAGYKKNKAGRCVRKGKKKAKRKGRK